MNPDYITDKFLQHFIASSLAEDIGDGDHSTQATVSALSQGRAKLLVKEEGILAGVSLAARIFQQVDTGLQLAGVKKDGDRVQKGDFAFHVAGPARSILTAERLVLNCMQRMSAIATKTDRMVKQIAGTKSKILDTRKTTPTFRLLEKWAVKIGGGENHRIGLYDMILLKDNHIDIAGGIEKALIQTKEYLRAAKLNLRVEVETRNLDEVRQVLQTGGVDIIMLDNMNPETMREAVNLIGDTCKTEASGNITEENVRRVAECGVDFISMGELTHSVKSMDMSLKVF